MVLFFFEIFPDCACVLRQKSVKWDTTVYIPVVGFSRVSLSDIQSRDQQTGEAGCGVYRLAR